jgi:NADH dehydrogenase FAD-containing subunit
LIEKNSYSNYTFNFPRYFVLQQAFITYSGIARDAPKGIFQLVQNVATAIRDGEVELKSRNRVNFEYLAIATGSTQAPPVRLLAREKAGAYTELPGLQSQIKEAKSIAVVGGGLVGIQLAGDIKTYNPEKRVVLVHSRSQLLPNFGKRLHEYVMGKMDEMGVEVILDERLELLTTSDPKGSGILLRLKKDRSERFDLIVSASSLNHSNHIGH